MKYKKIQPKIYIAVIILLFALLGMFFIYYKRNELTPIDVPNGYWKDAKTVYLNKQPIKDANPNTFELLYYDGFGDAAPEYARDDKSVYYKGELMKRSDAKSFTALLRGYAADDKSGYLNGQKIEGSDGKTFSLNGILCPNYSIDAYYIFWKNKKIEDSDPQTFECLGGIDPGDEMFNYVQDKNFIYYEDQIIKEH